MHRMRRDRSIDDAPLHCVSGIVCKTLGMRPRFAVDAVNEQAVGDWDAERTERGAIFIQNQYSIIELGVPLIYDDCPAHLRFLVQTVQESRIGHCRVVVEVAGSVEPEFYLSR